MTISHNAKWISESFLLFLWRHNRQIRTWLFFYSYIFPSIYIYIYIYICTSDVSTKHWSSIKSSWFVKKQQQKTPSATFGLRGAAWIRVSRQETWFWKHEFPATNLFFSAAAQTRSLQRSCAIASRCHHSSRARGGRTGLLKTSRLSPRSSDDSPPTAPPPCEAAPCAL